MLARIFAKCSDLAIFHHKDKSRGPYYVPYGVGIGGGDNIDITYCLDCGKIQSNEFPVSSETLSAVLET
jgi:hypothetical protein